MAEMEKSFGHEPDAIRTILTLAAVVIGVALCLHAIVNSGARGGPAPRPRQQRTTWSMGMAEMEKPFGHEPDAINYRTILICAGILVVVVTGIAVGLHFIMSGAVIPNHAEIAARPGQIPPKPRLEAHPQTDLAKFRAQKEALLSGYAWTDAQHANARIPIQRAMQIYVQQHSRANSAPASAASSAKPAQGARR